MYIFMTDRVFVKMRCSLNSLSGCIAHFDRSNLVSNISRDQGEHRCNTDNIGSLVSEFEMVIDCLLLLLSLFLSL